MHVPVAVGRPEVQVVGAAALLVHVAIELHHAVHPDVRAGPGRLGGEGAAAEHDLDRLAPARKRRRRRRWRGRRRRRRREARWVGRRRRRAADGDAARLPPAVAVVPPRRARRLGALRVQTFHARQPRGAGGVVARHLPFAVGSREVQVVDAAALVVHAAPALCHAIHPHVRAGFGALCAEGVAAEHDLDRHAPARKRWRRWRGRRRRGVT